MDYFDRNIGFFDLLPREVSRPYPSPARLDGIGYISNKKGLVEGYFESVNFSLILQGKGHYQYDNSVRYNIQAPCVLTQWPGANFNYGPDKNGWQELYLVFDKSSMDYFTKCGFVSPLKRWWQVMQENEFHRSLESLFGYFNKSLTPSVADQLDRIAEQLVLTSLLPLEVALSERDKVILEVRDMINADPCAKYDFSIIAHKYCLSDSVFRRSWSKQIGMPPGQYLIDQKMKLARKMLLETTLNVGEIAWRLGYEDPLYFSRLFRKFVGLSATRYRTSICGNSIINR